MLCADYLGEHGRLHKEGGLGRKGGSRGAGHGGAPTDHNFPGMVCANMIPYYPVTESAVRNTNVIFGPDLAGVRGRTVPRPPESIWTDYVQIPWIILERYQLVVLVVNEMFVNNVSFLVSVARGLNLITAQFTPTRTAEALASRIEQICHLYAHGSFAIGTVLMDNNFEKLHPLVLHLAINTTVAKEHVPKVEQRICLIKERGRGIPNTLPFKRMLCIMLVELIHNVGLWLNTFPSKSGMSKPLLLRELVLCHRLVFKKHCRAPFGRYCEVHEEPIQMNIMVTWGTPAIVLGPTGNLSCPLK